jgi:hypothetical protein
MITVPGWLFGGAISGCIILLAQSGLIWTNTLPSQKRLAWELEKCQHDLDRAKPKPAPSSTKPAHPYDEPPVKDKYQQYDIELDKAARKRDDLVRDCEQGVGQDTGHVAVKNWSGGVACLTVHGLLWSVAVDWPQIP